MARERPMSDTNAVEAGNRRFQDALAVAGGRRGVIHPEPSPGSQWLRGVVADAGRGPEPEPASESASAAPAAFPDLGQGARGPGALPVPTMSDVIRGAAHAKRQLVLDEIETERQLRVGRQLHTGEDRL
jgi:hypothetical protein